jgi:pimeloyl-[acyl-carrier protein] methyl ester esterase
MAEQAIAYTADGVGSPPLVLVPGWGHGRHVFNPLIEALAPHRRVLALDPPGVGGSRPDRCGADLAAIADAVAPVAEGPSAWVGWSLGGLVALAVARRWPGRVARVVLLAATPRFTAANDWPGTSAAELERFAEGLDDDPAGSVERFLGLQLAPGAGQRRTLAALRRALRHDGLPEASTLRAGLALLRDSDLRGWLSALQYPARVVLGEHDRLVPVSVAPHLGALGARVRVLADAGHAPFVDRSEETAMALLGERD